MTRIAGAAVLIASLVVAAAETSATKKETSQIVRLPPALRAFVKTRLGMSDHEADGAATAIVPLAEGVRTLALFYADPNMNGMHGGPLWMLKQTGHSYTLLSPEDSDLGGNMYVVCRAVSHGYHDFRVDQEGNAYEINSILWRFDGHVYQLHRRIFIDLAKEQFRRRC